MAKELIIMQGLPGSGKTDTDTEDPGRRAGSSACTSFSDQTHPHILETFMILIRFLIILFLKAGRFRWVISDGNDPGFRVYGVNVFYYKWHNSFICSKAFKRYRRAAKREIKAEFIVGSMLDAGPYKG